MKPSSGLWSTCPGTGNPSGPKGLEASAPEFWAKDHRCPTRAINYCFNRDYLPDAISIPFLEKTDPGPREDFRWPKLAGSRSIGSAV